MKLKTPVTMILTTGLLVAAALAVLTTGCGPASSPEGGAGGTGLFLTVSQPKDNSVASADRIEVKGSTSPGAVVSVNQEAVSADEKGNFAVTIGLEEGTNVLEVCASDATGKTAEVTLVVALVKQ